MLVGEYLKQFQVTQPEFARLINVSITHVSRLATGTRASPELALEIERVTRGKVTVIEAMYPDDSAFIERAKDRRTKWWSSFFIDEFESKEGRAA